MENNWIGRTPLSLIWPAAFLVAAGAVGSWLWLARGDGLQVLLAGTALAVLVVLGPVWRWRARSARRWNAVVDAYAEREIARLRGVNGRNRVRAHSPRTGARSRQVSQA
jgi:hypothetical protein